MAIDANAFIIRTGAIFARPFAPIVSIEYFPLVVFNYRVYLARTARRIHIKLFSIQIKNDSISCLFRAVTNAKKPPAPMSILIK